MNSPVLKRFSLVVIIVGILFFGYKYATNSKETPKVSDSADAFDSDLDQLMNDKASGVAADISMHGRNLKIDSLKSNTEKETQSKKTGPQDQFGPQKIKPGKVDPVTHQTPLKDSEIKSIQQIISSAASAINKKMTSNQFMTLLTKLNLQPKFMDQGSSALGSFVTIRTNNSLEGTRYIHAQFTGEYKNADLLQHISFQIRPGKDSFEQAANILERSLPKDRVVKESYKNYVLYTTPNGYVAWAKIADLDDLKGNKYNAASSEDEGTVIVTIEQEIHDMDGHDHH